MTAPVPDVDALLAHAEAATPEWAHITGRNTPYDWANVRWSTDRIACLRTADAEFVVACDPDTIRAVVTELVELRQRVKDAEERAERNLEHVADSYIHAEVVSQRDAARAERDDFATKLGACATVGRRLRGQVDGLRAELERLIQAGEESGTRMIFTAAIQDVLDRYPKETTR